MIAQQILNGLVVGSVYALFALGFTLIFGVHHILNMAHGAVFMWGAFFGLFAITRFDLPFPLGFVLAIVLAGLLSVALDWVAFRPLRRRGAPEFSAIVSSIGAGLVLMNIAQRVSDTRVLRLSFRYASDRNLLLPGLACDLDPGGDGPEHASDRRRPFCLSVLHAFRPADPRRRHQ
jgi:branched-chain amino acid transport system permease protein